MSKIIPNPGFDEYPMIKIDHNDAEEKLFRSSASGKMVRFRYDYKIKQNPNINDYIKNENGIFCMKVI